MTPVQATADKESVFDRIADYVSAAMGRPTKYYDLARNGRFVASIKTSARDFEAKPDGDQRNDRSTLSGLAGTRLVTGGIRGRRVAGGVVTAWQALRTRAGAGPRSAR